MGLRNQSYFKRDYKDQIFNKLGSKFATSLTKMKRLKVIKTGIISHEIQTD